MFGKYKLSGDFLKYTAVLMSGTVVAQLFGYVFAPVITRLYTPEEAAPLGLFLRIVAIGAALATARYEFSIPLAKNESHSFRLYQVALKNSIIVSCFSLLLIIYPVLITDSGYSFTYFLLIPPAILLTAFFNIGNNWALRSKLFKSMTYVKVSNSLVTNILKVLFGILAIGYMGLVFGTLAGLVVGNAWFFAEYFRAKNRYNIGFNSPGNYVLAKEYIDFPKINLPHVLTDLLRDLLVAFALLSLFSKSDFGLYDHSYRMLRLPVILVGMAIGQVLYQRCSEMNNKGENIGEIVRSSLVSLLLISIIPFAVIFFYGEPLFAFVFGAEWSGSGVYAQIMAPWLMVNFVTSPVSSIPLILRRQKEFYYLSVVGTLIMLATVYLPATLWDADIKDTLWAVTFGQVIYLISMLTMVLYYIFKKEIDNSNV